MNTATAINYIETSLNYIKETRNQLVEELVQAHNAETHIRGIARKIVNLGDDESYLLRAKQLIIEGEGMTNPNRWTIINLSSETTPTPTHHHLTLLEELLQ